MISSICSNSFIMAPEDGRPRLESNLGIEKLKLITWKWFGKYINELISIRDMSHPEAYHYELVHE